MSDERIVRRVFLERAGLAALGAACVVQSRDIHAQIAVPNSTGMESPRLKAPAGACDCHMHIYDPARFPMVPSQSERRQREPKIVTALSRSCHSLQRRFPECR